MTSKDRKDYTGKRLLFIGASGHFAPIIEKAKSLGVTSIVINFNPNAAAKPHADIPADVDTYNHDEVLAFARAQRVDGVFTSWNEFNLYTTAYVAKQMHLPFFAQKEQLDQLVTKDAFKATCIRYGAPVVPEYFHGNTLTKADTDKFEYPVIFKPTDSGGTRGMTILYDASGVREAAEKALSASAKKEFIVEKYLHDGQLIVIDFIVQDGVPHLCCVADRTIVRTSEERVPLAISYMYPSNDIDAVEQQALAPLTRLIQGLSIRDGVISFEAIVSEGRLYLIETQFRFGGTHFYTFVEKSSGVDLLQMMIDYALSGDFHRYDLTGRLTPHFSEPYACQNLQVDGGKIAEIRGVDKVKALPGVDWLVQIKCVGDVIPQDGSTAQNFAKIGLSAPSRRELYRLMDRIQHTLEVLDPDGNNLVRKNVPAALMA